MAIYLIRGRLSELVTREVSSLCKGSGGPRGDLFPSSAPLVLTVVVRSGSICSIQSWLLFKKSCHFIFNFEGVRGAWAASSGCRCRPLRQTFSLQAVRSRFPKICDESRKSSTPLRKSPYIHQKPFRVARLCRHKFS